MKDFKTNSRFGGRHGNDRSGGFSRPSFGGKPGYQKSGGRDQGMMFPAVCAGCGKTCEVPFKPNGKKPVYCRDCFAKNGGPANDGLSFKPRYEERGEGSRSYETSRSESPRTSPSNDGVERALKDIGTKLDRLIAILEERED